MIDEETGNNDKVAETTDIIIMIMGKLRFLKYSDRLRIIRALLSFYE